MGEEGSRSETAARLGMAEGKIAHVVVANIPSWKHSGFSVDPSVRLEAGDQEGVRRLLEYFLRVPSWWWGEPSTT